MMKRVKVFFVVAFSSCSCMAQEREALALFYNACNGASWTENLNWLSDETVCEWHGVTCQENGTIKELDLQQNNVECDSIPAALFELAVPPGTLQILSLQGNPDLDVDFTTMTTGQRVLLEKFFMQDTGLSSLENMNNVLSTNSLTAFSASGNGLEGEFPTNLMAFTNLRHLDMSYNQYTGMIPEGIGMYWSQLRTWSMAHNLLTGPMPDSIGFMSDLSLLFLHDNLMTGNITAELGRLQSLSTLFLNDQSLNGPLYHFASNPGLVILNVANNDLEGEVPSNFLQSVPPTLSEVMLIDIRNNALEGRLGSELARFPLLKFHASGNRFVDLDSELCMGSSDWYYGAVQEFGCDAILCPPGTFNSDGRQVSADFPCAACPDGTLSEFYGSTSCIGSAAGTTTEVIALGGGLTMTLGGPTMDTTTQTSTLGGPPPMEATPPVVPSRQEDSFPDNDIASESWRKFLRGGPGRN